MVDIPACIRIHMRAFQGFFLTFLGDQFLQELYASIARDLSGIGYVAETPEAILGFVIGTDQPSGLYQRLLRKRWWSFGWASVGALIRRPSILPRLLRAFTMPDQKMELRNCGTLMSIAVLPEAQGKKIGHLLVKAFLDEATRRSLEHVNLTTDRLNNDFANQFYTRLGFRLLRDYVTPEGRQMNEYVIDLIPNQVKQIDQANILSSPAIDK
jgi:GNAT superfamily N-acetyltransferase